MNDRWPIASIISFLDVIACAFGAIVLLVLILPVGENDGRGESYSLTVVDELTRKITNLTERVRERQLEFASLQAMIDEKSRSSDVRVSEDNVQSMISAIESQLSLKRERVLKERGLLKDQAFNSIVEEKGLPSHLYGIPVDSDHLVLVVDTSGSMKMIWPRVNRVIRDVLTNYPELIGFQIVSDQGEFLVQSDQRWLLPRDWQIQSALEKLESWNAYSNSSPVEGIEVAVSTLFSPGINMALFVVGDDYTGTDFDSFLSKID
ncbi:MAG: hypothetical protein QGI31_07615 [Dehalococcoidia bacterium]|jgi:hypothetical protein|nr:hypothetical protein [Dehalococcoidia bacterium]|tara:strand:+ start:533 stop:1321 length:789 start_codon:yes stop_codon:yes gene_type:complete